ncbi:MAG: DUF4071 domain-containing protein [Bryobacterales bacterium]|nr:DUF4071 domain-containing protein [Bryobacterales bacterium]
MEPLLGVPTCDRLSLPDFALVDITTSTLDVRFALGVRHALRPNTTVLIAAQNTLGTLPEDTILYPPDNAAAALAEVSERLSTLRGRPPVQLPFHILEQFHEIGRLKTDVFRDRVDYSSQVKARLDTARKSEQPREALLAFESELDPASADYSVLVDLLLSYRAVKAWPEMIALVAKMPTELARTLLVQEQFAFGLNRNGDWERAETILRELIAARGPSSETNSLLGRVYKDRWDQWQDIAWLDKAIDAYLEGFEADWRDAFPGINTVMLMEMRNPPDERRHKLIPLVRFAVERRVASGQPDYWDFATLIELAILANDHVAAHEALSKAVDAAREVWEPESTLATLRRIVTARQARGEDAAWIGTILQGLQQRMEAFSL